MIRHLLHRVDPYVEAGIEPLPPVHVPGWNDHDEKFASLAGEAKLVVEVGCWLGRSTIALAKACPKAEIIAVDTWLGSLEMWTDQNDPDRYGALRQVAGFPTIYRDWMQNIVSRGLADRVTPFPTTSSIALRWLRVKGIVPDLIYVDGSHEYEDAFSDIILAIATGCPLVCGDDYREDWPGVIKAVDAACNQAIKFRDGFWYLDRRPREL